MLPHHASATGECCLHIYASMRVMVYCNACGGLWSLGGGGDDEKGIPNSLDQASSPHNPNNNCATDQGTFGFEAIIPKCHLSFYCRSYLGRQLRSIMRGWGGMQGWADAYFTHTH